MQLQKFLLVAQGIGAGEVLRAIETAIPTETIEQVLGQTDRRETRKRKLRCLRRAMPTHLVVCLVIAMSIWSSDSMRTVLKNLGSRFTDTLVKARAVLASTKPIINYRSTAEIGMSGDESVISSIGTSISHLLPPQGHFYLGYE